MVTLDSMAVAQLFSYALLWNLFLSQKNPIHALQSIKIVYIV